MLYLDCVHVFCQPEFEGYTPLVGKGSWEDFQMKRVSVINFKGGVGKTTLSFHLAAYLAREHKVLLVDVDHQSSLSIVVLGDELWQDCVRKRNTVNRVFESFCNRRVAMPGDEIVIKNALNQKDDRYDF